MSGTDARTSEPRPSVAGLKRGTPEYRAAEAAYKRWRNANDPDWVARRRTNHNKYCNGRYKADPAYRSDVLNRTTGQQHKNKQALVALFGGACHGCGYHEHLAALQFHHTDRSKKTRRFVAASLSLKDMMSRKFLEELATCQLLCANCHAVHHANP